MLCMDQSKARCCVVMIWSITHTYVCRSPALACGYARLLLTNPVCHSEVGMGVVPSPEPVPRYMMHMPHDAPPENCASLIAMVLLEPLLQGRCTVLAKFWL